MQTFIRFSCPKCQKKLKHPIAGADVWCKGCGNVITVPGGSESKKQYASSQKTLSDHLRNPNNLFAWLLAALFAAMSLTCLISTIALAGAHFCVGGFFLVVSLAMTASFAKIGIDLLFAKANAIKNGYREANLFFGLVKLVLWEENEGGLFLRNKQITDVIYGPESGGGMKYIFPILGDEWKVHVPLTLRLCIFEDHRIMSREAVQLYVKLAYWWRIKDKEGLKKFYLLVAPEVRQTSDTGKETSTGYQSKKITGARQEPLSSELDIAERWMQTIIESCLRKIVSRELYLNVISREASKYLHDDVSLATQEAIALDDSFMATPDRLADSVQNVLSAEAATFGIEIKRVEVQEARLPDYLQNEIDKVLKAVLAPAQTKPEAEAIKMRVRANLEGIASVIGKEATGAGHIVGELKAMPMFGGLPQPFQSLIANLLSNQAAPPANSTEIATVDNTSDVAAKKL